jgi:hypothetical protein
MLECKRRKDWADEVPGVTLSLPFAVSSGLVLIHDFADQGKATAASIQEEWIRRTQGGVAGYTIPRTKDRTTKS